MMAGGVVNGDASLNGEVVNGDASLNGDAS